MAVITIGNEVIDRGSATNLNGSTWLFPTNPADGTGTIDTFSFWFDTNATGVKIGTFTGSVRDYASRDYETIGSVTAGSVQTFSGLTCDVVSGDLMGLYETGGNINHDGTGGYDIWYVPADGDWFAAGVKTFSSTLTSREASIGGTGTTAAPANLATLKAHNGIAKASFKTINTGTPIGNIKGRGVIV